MARQVIRVKLPPQPGDVALEKMREAQRAWGGEREPESKPVKLAITRGLTRGRPWTWQEVTVFIAKHKHQG